ncbi:MAG: hypothetical protein KC910_12385 [Candidatus Eremiobacteraeota bacterium]|nr:hypothetical protein [Candidatus Eremiobacteraeota bacterium]
MRRGFSLLEALIALAFLTLAVLGVLATVIFTGRLESKQTNRQRASMLCLTSMEQARARLETNLDEDVSETLDPHPRDAAFRLVRTQRWVGASLSLPDESLKEVEVIVYWHDANGDQHYRLMERFARP